MSDVPVPPPVNPPPLPDWARPAQRGAVPPPLPFAFPHRPFVAPGEYVGAAAALPYATRYVSTPPVDDPRRLPIRLLIVGIISVAWGMLMLSMTLAKLPESYDDYVNSIPPPPPAAVKLPPAAPALPYTGDVVRPDGLHANARRVVMQGVAKKLTLPPDRATMLEWFLADAGKLIFGPVDPAAGPDAVAGAIEKVAIETVQSEAKGPAEANVLVTHRGRTEILENRVVFRAVGGKVTTLRGNTIFGPDGHVCWSAQAIRAGLEPYRAGASGVAHSLTAEQAGAVAARVAGHTAGMYPVDYTSQRGATFRPAPLNLIITAAASSPHDPNIQLTLPKSERVIVLPDGRAYRPELFTHGVDAQGHPPQSPRPFQAALPGSLAALRLEPWLLGVNAVLGALLIVAGALTLAKRPGGARLHHLWMWPRIAASVAAIVLFEWYIGTLPAQGGVGPELKFFSVGVRVGAALTAMHAAAVLLTLRSAASRRHFAARGIVNGLVSDRTWAKWRTMRRGAVGRAMLAAIAGLSLYGAIRHYHAADGMNISYDGRELPHLALLTLAAILCFGAAWHLVASLRPAPPSVQPPSEKPPPLRPPAAPAAAAWGAAGMLLLMALPTWAGAAPKEGAEPSSAPEAAMVVPAAEQAERVQTAIEAISHAEASTGKPAAKKQLNALKSALSLGPEAERTAFAALNALDPAARKAVISALAERLRDRSIAPQAHEAAAAAMGSIVKQLSMDHFSSTSAAGSLVTAASGEADLVPAIVAALKQVECPVGAYPLWLAHAPPQQVVALMRRLALDEATPRSEAIHAASVLVRLGKPGLAAATSIAAGDDPAFAPLERAMPAASGASAPPDKRLALLLELRVAVMRSLNPYYRNARVDDDPAGAGEGVIRAAKLGLASEHVGLREAALTLLPLLGAEGARLLVSYYRDQAPPDQLSQLRRQIGSALGDYRYPNEADFAAPDHRVATAAVWSILLEHSPSRASKGDITKALPELRKLLASDEAELRQEAAAAMLGHPRLAEGLSDADLAALLDPAHPNVAALAARSQRVQSVQATMPLLIFRLLIVNPDPKVRKTAASRGAKLQPDADAAERFKAMLGSAHDDVREVAIGALDDGILPDAGPAALAAMGHPGALAMVRVQSASPSWPEPSAAPAAPAPAHPSVSLSDAVYTLGALALAVITAAAAVFTGRNDAPPVAAPAPGRI